MNLKTLAAALAATALVGVSAAHAQTTTCQRNVVSGAVVCNGPYGQSVTTPDGQGGYRTQGADGQTDTTPNFTRGGYNISGPNGPINDIEPDRTGGGYVVRGPNGVISRVTPDYTRGGYNITGPNGARMHCATDYTSGQLRCN